MRDDLRASGRTRRMAKAAIEWARTHTRANEFGRAPAVVIVTDQRFKRSYFIPMLRDLGLTVEEQSELGNGFVIFTAQEAQELGYWEDGRVKGIPLKAEYFVDHAVYENTYRELDHKRQLYSRPLSWAINECTGYTENGTNSTMKIFEDDATRTWHVEVGGRRAWGRSIPEAIWNFAHEYGEFSQDDKKA